MIDLAREWTAFAGALFSLMGVSLAAGARRSAEDALSWERQWRAAVGAPEPVRDEEPRRRRLVLAYRAGGVFFAGAGLVLLVLAATGRAPFAGRGAGREALFGGIFFTVCGLVLAVNAWLHRKRAPRFLDGELLDAEAPRPLGERVADFCSRGMIVLFLSFGVRLLREGLK
ncbi:MAG: hypothetical protein HYV14_12645 [Elusimicrobia bacterium]|nr:hypothetical protein [Elusimicrobiota bacterium]